MHTYLDDFLIRGNEAQQLLIFSEFVVKKMKNWGVRINEKKSKTVPARRIKFLGYEISKYLATIPIEKRDEILFNIREFQE